MNPFQQILYDLQRGGGEAARWGHASRDVGDTLHTMVALVKAYGDDLTWTGADVVALTRLVLERETFYLLREEADHARKD